MRTEKNSVYKLTECGILLALGVVLSMVKLADLPYGGSVTLASMLPVALISYRYGLKWGLSSALAYGVVQQLLGLNSLKWVSTPLSIVAVILLDYILAFTVIGFAGVFRKKIRANGLSLASGMLLACVLRYICHVLVGATVWAGISIPTAAALIYSMAYNATYMIPETIITVAVAYYLASCIDFSAPMPKRVIRTENAKADILRISGTGVLLAGLAYITANIFKELQNPETGDFDITAITAMSKYDVAQLIVVAVLAVVVFLATTMVSASIKNNKENN